MFRRNFLKASASLAFGSALASTLPLSAAAAPKASTPADTARGQFKGRIRKSLKWGMVADRSLPLADTFGKLRESGFDGVEPSLAEVTNVEAWVKASQASGLTIDGTVTAGNLAELPHGIELTRDLGGDSTLVTASYPPDRPILESWNITQDQIRAAIPTAEKHRIKILVENVWRTFLISPFDLQRYIDEIGSPWVQVHFDTGNCLPPSGIAEHWIQLLGRRIQKLDIKEFHVEKAMKEGMPKGFSAPLGEGSVNWTRVRAELGRIAFTGWAAAELRRGDWDYLADVARRMDLVLDLAV